MNELKPCPFCGSKAKLVGECDMVWARCTNDDCMAERISKFDEPEDAIADWNQMLEEEMPRLEVIKFSEAMEVELKENDYKGGWKRCKPEFLIAKLTEEVKELYEASKKMDDNKYNYLLTDEELTKLKKEVLSEAADVANIVMMIADVWGAL